MNNYNTHFAETNVPEPLPDKWVNTEIRAMLHGLGDSRSPLPATVNLVENVMMEQLRSAIYQASDVSAMQERNTLKAEDFLFLMRKNTIKVRRFLKYLNVKSQVKASTQNIGEDSEFSVKSTKKSQSDEYLEFFINTNDMFQLEIEKPDVVKYERLVRADQISSSLDNANYAEYYRCRRATFSSPPQKVAKFYEAVMRTIKDASEVPKFNASAKEILCYFAYETIAQIVDLAFLVRQDAASQASDPFNRYTSMTFPHPPFTPSASSQLIGVGQPLTPGEVREALRRYFSSQFNPLKSYSHIRNRLLAC